jgi:hypothetical protein
MFQQLQYSTFKPFDFDLFAGLDVSKKSISATFLSQNGISKSLTFPHLSYNLISFVNKHYVNKRIAFVYEAGPTGFGLYDDLTAAGFFCMVVGPAQMPQTPSDRVKTNRRDSLKLALALRGGQIRSAYCLNRSSIHATKSGHHICKTSSSTGNGIRRSSRSIRSLGVSLIGPQYGDTLTIAGTTGFSGIESTFPSITSSPMRTQA